MNFHVFLSVNALPTPEPAEIVGTFLAKVFERNYDG